MYVKFFKNDHAKAIQMKKITMYLFMVWLRLSKVKKVNQKKQPIECNVIVFSKKVDCFYKYRVKIFKMTMPKPSKMKKTMSFFMLWLMLSKVKKVNWKKQTMECNTIVFSKKWCVSTNIMSKFSK
jgi:hypothetical protein